MGRGSRSAQRDTDSSSLTSDYDPLERLLLRPPSLPAPVSEPVFEPFTEVEDLRTWHPDAQARPVVRSSGRPAGVSLFKPEKAVFSPHLGFEEPRRVVECVRRETRREVLFAKRKMRGRAGSKPRRTWRSDIRC